MNTTLVNLGKSLTKIKGKTLALLSAYSPEILTGLGIAGLFGTVALTAKAAVKIDHILKEAEEVKGEKLNVKEIIQETWKEAVPVVLATAATGACIFASHQIDAKRKAALMAAYALAEENLESLSSSLKEMADEETYEKVKANAAKNCVVDVDGKLVEGVRNDGSICCYDKMSGRLFWSTKNKIEAAVNSVNQMIISDWSAMLNDFYNELGIDPSYVGDELGWNSNNMLSVSFDTVLTEGGDVMLVLDYKAYPEYRLL